MRFAGARVRIVEEGELVVGGVGASELAERFGTPLFVYCEDTVRSRARALRVAAGEDARNSTMRSVA